MEETIEFLQIELEKDFGYHDDSAIQALQQSVQDLKYVKKFYYIFKITFFLFLGNINSCTPESRLKMSFRRVLLE